MSIFSLHSSFRPQIEIAPEIVYQQHFCFRCCHFIRNKCKWLIKQIEKDVGPTLLMLYKCFVLIGCATDATV